MSNSKEASRETEDAHSLEDEVYKHSAKAYLKALNDLEDYTKANGDHNVRFRELEQRVKETCDRMMHANTLLNDSMQRKKDVHPIDALYAPPTKKDRAMHSDIAYQGPVPATYYSVPMETIEAYNQLHNLFVPQSHTMPRPLSLLYGPRQFGKTTIAHRLGDEIATNPSVSYVFLRLTDDIVQTETAFWNVISHGAGRMVNNERELEIHLSDVKKRLCLFIDELDLMFKNEDLTSKFINVISRWQGASYFYGFLGIGSYDLINLHLRHNKYERTSPFNLPNIVAVKPFTDNQMIDFFELIKLSYNFTIHTRHEIMAYSAGAPGVFGSLIYCTISAGMWKCEFLEWYNWFNQQNFETYLSQFNNTYERLREDLKFLGTEDWEALEHLIRYQKVFPSQFPRKNFEGLLVMGVAIKINTGQVELSSAMMRRICMEALPVREIDQVGSVNDPVGILVLALCWVKSDVIGQSLVANRQCPSESVFQFEVYASIRGIFAKQGSSRKVFAEARDVSDKQRVDIIICNGNNKYGFELKVNKLNRSEIEAAVIQADNYKTLLKIDSMFVINFVPRGHSVDNLYLVDGYNDIKVIHIMFSDTCKEYEIRYLGDDGDVKYLQASTKL